MDLADLHRSGLFAQVEWHAEIGSTNTRALELATAVDQPTPLLIGADRQTAGRGRGGNRWWSTTGALTFSLVLDPTEDFLGPDVPPLTPAHWPRLSLVAALALCHELERLIPEITAQLKWPNDVHVAGRKLAGILVETASSPGSTPRLVLGMGVNVNNSLRDAPPELQATACSLIDLMGGLLLPDSVSEVPLSAGPVSVGPVSAGSVATQASLTPGNAGSGGEPAVDRLKVLCGWMREFTELAQGLAQNDPLLPEGWRQRCPLAGRHVSLQAGERTVSGLCLGIDDSGALLVDTPGGTERCFGGVLVRVQG
jgi:BirA family biotin operon repressor/biotin-[acetyl-CoA-carboxylase] ligase